ncbi:MAG: hypothetical protein RIC06_00415 [Cyclobacteriaceae bacterium]
MKKVLSFLSNIEEVPAEQRESTIDKIDQSKTFRIKVGEKLLYIIDRCEDHVKAQLTAIMFKHFLKGELSYTDFLRAAKTLEQIPFDDLEWFVNADWNELSIEESAEFIVWGLFDMQPRRMEVEPISKPTWDESTKYELKGEAINATISHNGRNIRKYLKNEMQQSG